MPWGKSELPLDVRREMSAVLAEHIRGSAVTEVLTGPRVVYLVGAIETIEEVGDPARAALRERDMQRGELLEHA